MTRGRLALCCLLGGLLFAGTMWLFWPALQGEFLHYDDDVYVTENPIVQQGFTRESVRWAFTTLHAVNWHPLTWLSHLLDVELFGRSAWGHHLTSVLLHALNAVLLFGAVSAMTRAPWPAFFVAALFAVHPLRVESVAWISERKDVLCACFGFAALWAYASFAARGGALRYLAVLLLFAASLLSKPMLVSLPLVLLLLDHWPLRRSERTRWRRLILEKMPLFAMAGAISLVTLKAQSEGPLRSLEEVPLALRVMNAAVAYVEYLAQTVHPVDLAVLYPHPGRSLPLWKGIAALVALAAVSVGVARARRQPCLVVGWLWYLFALLPVIGIVQVGEQAHADRYTYVPIVGIELAVAFFVAPLVAGSKARAAAAALLASAGVLLLAPMTRAQIDVWRSTEPLFEHALAVTTDNAVAHTELGVIVASQGRVDEARAHFEEAIRIDPTFSPARSFLGKALALSGKPIDAEAVLREALKLDPKTPRGHQHLGVALQLQRRWKEAAAEYRLALEAGDARGVENVYESLAATLRLDGDVAGARKAAEELVLAHPEYAKGHGLLARELLAEGKAREALAQADEAIRRQPRLADAHFVRGAALGTLGRFNEAVESFRQALSLDPRHEEAKEGLRRALPRAR